MPVPPIRDRSHTAVAVIWIDWYPYHVARFIGLKSTCEFAGKVIGIELVGGIGSMPASSSAKNYQTTSGPDPDAGSDWNGPDSSGSP